MKRLALIAAALSLSACATTDGQRSTWSRSDTQREIAFQVINALDAVQTNQIRHRDDVKEVGPIASSLMGPEPSASDVAMYFSTLAVTHYLIGRALPAKARKYWQIGTIANHGYTVATNCTELRLAC